jgi:hypothetical protein
MMKLPERHKRNANAPAKKVANLGSSKVKAPAEEFIPMGPVRLKLVVGCLESDIPKFSENAVAVANQIIASKDPDVVISHKGRKVRKEDIIKILEWYADNMGKTVAELVPAGVTSEDISGLLAKLKAS